MTKLFSHEGSKDIKVTLLVNVLKWALAAKTRITRSNGP